MLYVIMSIHFSCSVLYNTDSKKQQSLYGASRGCPLHIISVLEMSPFLEVLGIIRGLSKFMGHKYDVDLYVNLKIKTHTGY